jgi:hypothetical protein
LPIADESSTIACQSLFAASSELVSPRVLALPLHPFISSRQHRSMPEEAQKDVVQLAEQVAEGFAALSGEYQILFDQQKQLESKLSWAKQQVSCGSLFSFPFVMKHL